MFCVVGIDSKNLHFYVGVSQIMSEIQMNEIPDDTKYLLSGFIRRMEKEVNNDIPEVIMMIILSFYYIAEYFKDTDCELSEKNTKITSAGHNRNGYGNLIIDSTSNGCHQWQFKIGFIKFSLMVGITESSINTTCPIYTVKGKGYGYHSRGKTCIPKSKGTGYKSIEKKPRFKEGDKVQMVLNLDKKSLSFKLNEGDTCSIENIKIGQDIDYKLAVFMGDPGDSLQLISYHKERHNEISIA